LRVCVAWLHLVANHRSAFVACHTVQASKSVAISPSPDWHRERASESDILRLASAHSLTHSLSHSLTSSSITALRCSNRITHTSKVSLPRPNHSLNPNHNKNREILCVEWRRSWLPAFCFCRLCRCCCSSLLLGARGIGVKLPLPPPPSLPSISLAPSLSARLPTRPHHPCLASSLAPLSFAALGTFSQAASNRPREAATTVPC